MTTGNTSNEIKTALADITNGDLVEAGRRLLETLGYHSDRTLSLSGTVDDFIAEFAAPNQSTQTEARFRERAVSARILFQFTDSEIAAAQPPSLATGEFDKGDVRSFMFVAVELHDDDYPRGAYVELTREINKRLVVPTVVLFRTASGRFSLAFVHRRPHKRDQRRSVLGSVSLIREIDSAKPHRAHLDILGKLALPERLSWMDTHRKQRNFDGLLTAWLDALDTEELNRNFYKQLFNWFERAVEEAKFPTDQAKTLSPEEHIIRLITRLLFVWFIKEKGLIAPELFIEEQIDSLLRNYNRENGDSYYRAVLQNLFFATLNSEIQQRGFSQKSNTTHRDFSRYRYEAEMADPDRLLDLFAETPFINGGLFDCLDSFESVRDGGYRIDCFTDNMIDSKRSEFGILSIPNRLFFGESGLIDLFERFQFTVEENTPAEQEVALDPELLGKVFENLLAAYNPETRETARKQTGSYYTPRLVVDYMVDETLVATLIQKCPPVDGKNESWRERLLDLFDYEVDYEADYGGDVSNCLKEYEEEDLVRAIADIKLIDPAVGSGAFPMGALHKLTLALRRLDPQNIIWECLQKEFAGKRAIAAFDTEDHAERDAELDEISAIFEQYRDSDFGRKLYLIQNSIFGVDIQPVACQISKLRFFISLAIEQERDHSANNFGIKPLPNLETRFVAANSLIGLQDNWMLTSEKARGIELELMDNREQHFHATTRERKLACWNRDQKLREELADELESIGMPADDVKKIAYWNPYDPNACADWFDSQYMFGVKNGFDIIIGNPPYVESRNSLLSSELKDAYISQVYSDWQVKLSRGSDLLIYFYARAPKFLNEMGCGCFITQNAWLSTDYGKKFQDFTHGKLSFERIIDSSSKFFPDSKSQNINAIITFFGTRKVAEIEYAIADSKMAIVPEKTIAAEQSMKWGHLFLMPDFFMGILEKMSVRESARKVITFGQGVNLRKSKLDLPGSNVPIIVKDISFVATSADGRVRHDKISSTKLKKIPALVMPRGIGERYYCSFNLCKALSYSGVELYLPNELWESDLHYCLWAFLNSSLAWLFREITGRRNLGGGMLKAEATDMKTLPVNFNFNFADEAKHVFELMKARDPLPVSEEVYKEEHLLLDDMTASYFGITSQSEAIRRALIDSVEYRLSKSRPKK